MNGGANRTTLPPATESSTPFSRQRATTGAGVAVDDEPAQEAAAAHLVGVAGILLDERLRACCARYSPASVDALEQPLVLDDVEHRERGRARERVAAERRRVRTRRGRRSPCASLVAGHAWRRSGTPPPSPLASVITSGAHVLLLVAEEGAGAADAGLHLVEDQHRAGVVAQSAQRLRGSPAAATMMPPSAWIGSTMTAQVCR